MRLILLATITLMLWQSTTQTKCNLGCLACSKVTNVDFECAVCDLFNQYALTENGLCEKSPVENCDVASSDHTRRLCNQCKSGYIFDLISFKCVEIPAASVIDKCSKYLALNHCMTCEVGYYMKEGLCVSVDTQVDGCVEYDSTGENCLACENGKYLTADKACTSFETKENCVLYSNKNCVTCKSGHIKEVNYFSSQKITSSLAESFISSMNAGEGQIVDPSPHVCIELNINQCLTYKNFNECAICNDGYFVNAERTCSLNPPNEIANCKYYSDMETCKECEPSHYLSSNECVERTLVDNCLEYEISSSQCTKCSLQHFLVLNECKERVMSLNTSYCTEKTLDADTCESCKNRFKLTNDKLKCLFQIEHCSQYNMTDTTLLSESLICTECEQGYYPDQFNAQVCHAQDVTNCQAYVTNSGNCQTCEPGFFKHSTENKCVAYSVQYCQTPKADENKCEVCFTGFYNSAGECKPYTVSNCLDYSDTSDACNTCIDNHYLNSNNCFQYNLVGCSENSPNSNKCITCVSDYYLDSNSKQCIKNNLQNCELASSSANECLQCKDNYYLSSAKTCLMHNVPNCKFGFANDDNTCKTDGCEDGYMLDSNNQCVMPSLPFCVSYSSLTECQECETGYSLYGDSCHLGTTPNCLEYTADSVNCSLCDDGYYLTTVETEEKCIPQIARGCIEFENKTTIDCKTCQIGYYLESTDKTCYPFTVQNCTEFVSNADQCDSSGCEDGFVLDIPSKNCIRISIDGCTDAELDDGKQVCTTCGDNYILTTDGNCVLSGHIPNCVKYDPSSDGDCTECGAGFAVNSSDSKICDPLEPVDFCEVPNLNVVDSCSRCKPGYILGTSSPYTCTEYTGCLAHSSISTGTADCVLCEGATFPDSATTACVDYTNKATLFADPNCASSQADDTCFSCKNGYFLTNFGTTAKRTIYNPNCIKFDTTNTEICILCREGYQVKYDGTNSKGYCEKPTSGQVCIEKSGANTLDETTSQLSNATECLKCANYDTHYLDTGTCTARTTSPNPFLADNCEKYLDIAEKCEYCKEGTTPLEFTDSNLSLPKRYGVCTAYSYPGNPQISVTESTNKCDVFEMKADDSQSGTPGCIVCKPGNTNSTGTCSATTDCSIDTMFDVTDNTFKSISRTNDANFTGCVNGLPAGAMDLKCDLASTKYSILNLTVTLGESETTANLTFTSKRTPFIDETSTVEPFASALAGIGCDALETVTSATTFKAYDDILGAESATVVVYANDTDLTSSDKCKHFYRQDGFDFCAACKLGSVPIIHQAFNSSNNAFAAIKCVDSDEFQRKFKGALSPFDTDNPSPHDLFPYDSCTDETKTLVAFVENHDNGKYYWKVNTKKSKTAGMVCVNMKDAIKLANCQYYVSSDHEYLFETTTETSQPASLLCGMCKAGYKATYDSSTGTITACDAIANCDTTASKNTFLNACETCNPGYAYASPVTTALTDFQACEQMIGPYKTDNCQIFVKDDLTTTNEEKTDICILCKKNYGFTITKNGEYLCVPIDKTENGCQSYGKEPNFFSYNGTLPANSPITTATTGWTAVSTTNTLNSQKLSIYLDYFYKDTKHTNAYGCISCGRDPDDLTKVFYPYGHSSSTRVDLAPACVNIFTTPYNMIENCLHMAATSSSMESHCSVCKEGYVYHILEKKCLEETPETEKYLIFGEGGPLSQYNSCKAGYKLMNKVCVDVSNCQVYDTGRCYVCEEGYIFDETVITRCVPLPADSECIHFAIDRCLRCKDNKVPYSYENLNRGAGQLNQLPSKILCSEQKNSEITTGDFLEFTTHFSDFFYIKLDGTHELLPSISDYPKAGYTETTISSTGINVMTMYCMPIPSINNCLEINYTELKCNVCSYGYYRINGFCVKGDVKNCKTYLENPSECLECYPGYFWNSSDSECQKYTVQNCEFKDLYSDGCHRCINGFHLNENRKCELNKMMNCMDVNNFGGKCIYCKENYKLNDDGECEAISVKGCLHLDGITGKCFVCNDGYYLDFANNACEKVSEGCLMYHPNFNICYKCEDKYYIDSTQNTCELRKNTDCLLGAPYNDNCVTCKPNSFMKDGVCYEHSVTNCSLYNPNSDTCLDCDQDYQLDSTFKCVANTDSGCQRPNKYGSGCSQCKNGYYYDITSTSCKAYEVKCKFYHPNLDKCLACLDGQFLNVDICDDNTAMNCRDKSISANSCITCKDGYYLADTGDCKLYSTQNCEVFHSYADKCFRCKDGFYLTSDLECKLYSFSSCEIFDLYSDACYRCNDDFYVDNDRKCKQRHAEGCDGVVLNSDRCLNCNPGYFLQNGLCHLYTQTLCKVFEPTSDNCISCQSNAYLSAGNCIEYKKTNCKTFHKNIDGCTSCEADMYLDNNSCFEYDLENCKDKHPNDNLCLKCEEGKWFRNAHGKCVDPTPVENCQKYMDYFDECEECELGYFLKDKKCHLNPSGVANCVEYLNENFCAKCEVPYFLKDNICVKSDDVIANCTYYSFNSTCSKCEPTYFLEANECVMSNLTCATYLNRENCASCGVNQVLDPTGSQIKCVASGIDNCLEASYKSDGAAVDPTLDPAPATTYYQCDQCASEHYLNFNSCEPTTSVTDCDLYKSEEECIKCKSGFTLSADGKSCSVISGLGTGCDIGQETLLPACSVCSAGYVLGSDGECTKCAVNGCAICDILNQRKCKLCQEGYQMNELFYCLKISESESRENEYDDILQGTELLKMENSNILSILTMVTFLVTFFKKL